MKAQERNVFDLTFISYRVYSNPDPGTVIAKDVYLTNEYFLFIYFDGIW